MYTYSMPIAGDFENVLVEQIARSSAHLGLDDRAEVLLWMHVATKRGRSSSYVRHVLSHQGQFAPILLNSIVAHTTIDKAWVKKRFFGLLSGQPLKMRFTLMSAPVLFAGENVRLEAILEDYVERARIMAFNHWYKRLSAREVDGKVVGASSSDIQVHLEHESLILQEEIVRLAS